jgi:predicted SnoaL-like aldol condensation-catalyzing enzyme
MDGVATEPQNGIARLAAAEDFVRFFAEGWKQPKPQGFLDHFLPRVHPEARFDQPVLPPVAGPAGFETSFRELFAAFPDYLVTVDDWATRGDVVFIGITHRLSGPGGASWRGVDEIVLEDGLIRERIAHFDSLATLPVALRAPRAWPSLARWALARARSGAPGSR